MKDKRITYDWIAQPHGTKQNDHAKIIDVIVVSGNTKYLIETAFGDVIEIYPRQVTSIT